MSAIATLFDEAVHIPAYVRDLATFRRWAHSDEFPQRGRISYIGGEIIIDMSPQEIETHAKIKTLLYGELWDLLKHDDIGEVLTDDTLFVNEAADVSNEPDLTFCSWDSLRSGRVEYRERVEGSGRRVEVVGSPDLVVEVVSRSSVTKDTQKLPGAYFNAGVDEYWLIDARREVDFRILVRGDTAFEEVPPDDDGFVRSTVFGRRFRIVRETNPVGMARYRLETRPA